jgi:chorismate mutase
VAEERSVDGLASLRKQIDALDDALVRLLNARAACALEIGRVKKDAGLPIYQPSREAEVLGHVQEINPGPLDDGAVRRLFERIIDEARRLERIAEGDAPGESPGHQQRQKGWRDSGTE